MKTICFYFQVHQPFRLRRYRFFDIGQYHNYFDEYANRSIMRKVAEKCYLPTNNLMLSLINEFGIVSKYPTPYRGQPSTSLKCMLRMFSILPKAG